VLLERDQSSSELYAAIVSAARARAVTLSRVSEAPDLEALLALVAIGDAVTFLARRTAELVAPTSAVVWRPVVDLPIRLSDLVTWRVKDASTPVVRALIESAREVRPHLQKDAEPRTGAPRSRSQAKKR
jgi:LysR family transcriptional regulator, benzoate and cis,cis-muconate-responsive activator of ben and cat genes